MVDCAKLLFAATLVLLPACAPDAPPPIVVPEWAKVAPEQVAEAKKHGVPVAFENDLGMRFVLIPAGTFLMGSREPDPAGFEEPFASDTHPLHEVVITAAFYIQATEVTNQHYRRMHVGHAGDEPGDSKFDTDLQPVIGVSFEDAKTYASRLSELAGTRAYRLPTEAEWEYACRAGATGRYTFGEEVGELRRHANFGDIRYDDRVDAAGVNLDDGHAATAPVASYLPNSWGLYDMHGNVWEWCRDWYAERHPARSVSDPTGPRKEDAPPRRSTWYWRGREREYRGPLRVLRGGAWHNDPGSLTSENRSKAAPGYQSNGVGFRLVADLPEKGE